MNRKNVILIVVVVVIIIIAVAAYLIYKNVGKSNTDTGDNITDEEKGGGDTGGESSGGGYIAPVVISDKPANILDFQKFANSKGYTPKLKEDGKWGPKTAAAWSSLKNDYNKKSSGCPEGTYPYQGMCRPILSSGTSVTTTGLKKGDAVYAKIPDLVFYQYPSNGSSMARLSGFNISKSVGIYETASTEGFSKIWVNVNAVTPSGYSVVKAPFWAYVRTNLIKK